MKLIQSKKAILIVIFFVVIISLVAFFVCGFFTFRERYNLLFAESTSLNFQRDDMTHIHINSRGNLIDINNVVIRNPEKINEIINYLNSLELVEAELPRRLSRQINASEDVGWISIYIGESIDHNPGDFVSFYASYMVFTYRGHELFGRYTYYVRNLDFCNMTKTSNVYQFLHELINEHSD